MGWNQKTAMLSLFRKRKQIYGDVKLQWVLSCVRLAVLFGNLVASLALDGESESKRVEREEKISEAGRCSKVV